MSKYVSIIAVAILSAVTGPGVSAENYVNWKGGFWFTVPESWEKVDYRIVDRFLAYTDTTRDVFEYEAVFAPTSVPFAGDAYLVVTFDSIGTLSRAETDSILEAIAASYSTDVYDAPVVQLMSDLVPGKPRINRVEKAISVLSEMAYDPRAMKKVWQYIRLNDRGLISLFFYSPESTYEQNKPTFDSIVQSLSFENLKDAAGQEQLVFTNIGADSLAGSGVGATSASETGAPEGIANIRDIILYAVIIVIVFGLIWNFVIAPRMRKKTSQSD